MLDNNDAICAGLVHDSGVVNLRNNTFNGDIELDLTGNLIPTNNNFVSLGSTTKRYKDLYLSGSVYSPTGIVNDLTVESTISLGVAGSDYSLPITRGTLGQVLQTDSSGVASWINRSVLTDEDLAQTRCTYAGTDKTGNPSGGSGYDNTLYGNAVAPSLTTGALNTGIGSVCFTSLVGGFANTAVGWSSLVDLTSGNQNTAIGNNSGRDIITGSTNVCLGQDTTVGNSAAVNRIVIGAGAVGGINNSCVIGSAALTAIYSGSDNICDLGSSTRRFKDGYFGTSVNTTLVTDGVNSITLTPTNSLPLVSDDFSRSTPTLNDGGVLTGTLSGFPVLDIINDRVQ
jgi:hypothetical protein